MSYTRKIGNMTVFVASASSPEDIYDEFYEEIRRKILDDGYKPTTSMDNLISNVVLSFDCDDNYGEYDPKTGYGGYGDSFTLEECFRYVEDCGGWLEFDWLA